MQLEIQIIDGKIQCCGKELKFWQAKSEGFRAYHPEEAICEVCKAIFEKKGKKIYKGKVESSGDQKWICCDCGGEVLAESVAHPIWDGPFPCSGSGQCHYEQVPYCPKCEPKPNFNGTPIQVDFFTGEVKNK